MDNSELEKDVAEEEVTPTKKGVLPILLLLAVIITGVVVVGLKIGQNLSQPRLSRYGVLINDYFTARVKNDTNMIQSYLLGSVVDETSKVNLKSSKYTLFLYEVKATVVSNKSLPSKTVLFSLNLNENQVQVSYLNEAEIVLSNGEPRLKSIRILHKGKKL